MNLSLRSAAPGDEEQLLALMREFNVGEHIEITPERLRPPLARLLAEPDLGRVWLVEIDGRASGYAVLTFGFDLEFEGRDAFLTEIYLEPSARGRGSGARVMAALEAEAARLGVRAIHLVVRPENTPALRLYQRAGYSAPPRVLLSKRIG